MQPCAGLRKVIVDEWQMVQVNEGVVVCVLGKDDLMEEKVAEVVKEKVVEVVKEKAALPVAAPAGVEDT